MKALKTSRADTDERCPYCDDTGDVHDQTGEYRGVCICSADVFISLEMTNKDVERRLAASGLMNPSAK